MVDHCHTGMTYWDTWINWSHILCEKGIKFIQGKASVSPLKICWRVSVVELRANMTLYPELENKNNKDKHWASVGWETQTIRCVCSAVKLIFFSFIQDLKFIHNLKTAWQHPLGKLDHGTAWSTCMAHQKSSWLQTDPLVEQTLCPSIKLHIKRQPIHARS